ncbi:hypothetical protein DDZ13_09880 [Coraliomargarita sinensis]|uniref:histidine kinase n=1 Tax=Coraliomargarita sinensis TaxID=2174842 RepID=A0A317ZJ67_9BACT|nr:HAMP domain-containing sensor histidine kinase [Coraliomargarita sinensis]PXA03938.1 hypothetical protein DDZ13_09880 [Coraliomargarita sinensis]
MLAIRQFLKFFYAALFFFSFTSAAGASEPPNFLHSIPLESGWEYRWGDSPFDGVMPLWTVNPSEDDWKPIDFPSDPPEREGRTNAWFRVQLPDTVELGQSLYIYSIDLIAEVYLDGVRIYRYGTFEEDGTGRFEGWPWHLIHLPDDYPGKYLYFRVYSDYPDIGLWGQVRLGSEYGHIQAIIHRDIFPFTVGLALLSVAVGCLLLGIILRSPTSLLLSLLFFNLGQIPILESQLKQLVLFAPVFWQYFAAGSYFLLPVSIAAVAHFLFGRGLWRTHQIVWILHLFYLVGALSLSASGLVNLSSTYIYFDCLSLFSLLAVALSMSVLARGSTLNKRIFAGGCWGIYLVLLYNGLTAHGFLPWAHRSEYLGPLILLIGFLTILLRRYFDLKVSLRERTKELKELNENLEARIDERTRELMESNRTKDRFLAIIGHDLRGPIGAFAYLLDEYAQESEDIPAEDLPSLRDSANEVHQLLENLLLWANSQEGQVSAKKTTARLLPLAEKAYRQIRGPAEHKGVTVTLEIPSEFYVHVDQEMIITVLRNLLANAVKFTHPGGSVQIITQKVGDKIHVACVDNGVGMSKQQLQAFVTGENSADTQLGTKGEQGTGLGLVICREFIRLHGSQLTAESAPDTGTTLRFELPTIG